MCGLSDEQSGGRGQLVKTLGEMEQCEHKQALSSAKVR